MGIKEMIRNVDIFGKSVELRLEKKKKHKTLCGGIMTILNIVLMSILAYYFMERVIWNKDGSVDTKNILNVPQQLEFKSYELGFAINIFDIKSHSKLFNENIHHYIYSNQSISLINQPFRIKAYYIQQNFTTPENRDRENSQNVIDIPLIPCNQSRLYQQYWIQLFNIPDFRVNEFLCPDFKFDSIVMIGDSISQINSGLQIQVDIDQNFIQKMEINNKNNNNNSNTNNKIDWKEQLDDSLVIVKFYDQMAYLESYNEPVKELCRTVYEWINLDITRIIEMKYSQEIIKTDQGMYFYEYSQKQFNKIHEVFYFSHKFTGNNNYNDNSQNNSTQNNNCGLLSVFTSVSQIQTVYQRSYLKVTVVLAYLGGFLQLSLIFGKIITKPFVRLSFYTSFVNEVFQFEDQSNQNIPNSPDLKSNQQLSQTQNIQPSTTSGHIMITSEEGVTANANNAINGSGGNNNNNSSMNKNLMYVSSPSLPNRSIFYQNQTKGSIDLTQTDINQTMFLNETQIIMPNLLQQQQSQSQQNNRKSTLKRTSQIQFKNLQIQQQQQDDEQYQFKRNIQQNKSYIYQDSQKNSIQIASPYIYSELNTPVQIKKKSLYKNQTLLDNFRQYFDADRLEKKLIIDFKCFILEFCQKIFMIFKCCCSKKYLQQLRQSSMKKLNFSKKKVKERLDIIYIVQKLQEIDKLKQIVLNKNQRKLFEYLPRPVLRNDLIFSKDNNNNNNNNNQASQNKVKQQSKQQQKSSECWIAFIDITNKESLDKNDKKVIKLLDIKAKNIFEITSQKISEQIQEQIGLQSSKIIKPSQFSKDQQQLQQQQQLFITDSLNSSTIKYPNPILHRKSSSFYQFSIQGSNKRNSSKLYNKQQGQKFSMSKQQNDLQIFDTQIVSLNNLDSQSKQDLDNNNNKGNNQNQELQQQENKKNNNGQKQQQGGGFTFTQQSSPELSESFSSSNSSSSSSSSEFSDNTEQVYQAEIAKSKNNNNSINRQSYKQQIQLQQFQQQMKNHKDSLNNDQYYKQNNIIKLELNEIPENNIEKSPVQSQEIQELDNNINKINNINNNNNESPQLQLNLNEFSLNDVQSNIQMNKCPNLNIFFNDSICEDNTSIRQKHPTTKKNKQQKKENKIRIKSKTMKNSESIQFGNKLKYFDEFKNSDTERNKDEDINCQDGSADQIKNNQNYNHNNLSQFGIEQNQQNNKMNQLHLQVNQLIQKQGPITPITPICQVPLKNNINNNNNNNKINNILEQPQQVQQIQQMEQQIPTKKQIENSFLMKRRNQLIINSNQKICTPLTTKKGIRDKQEQKDIYNSASFTQFLKNITPLIIETTVSSHINQQPQKNQ